MGAKSKYQSIEASHQRPMRDILIDAYKQHGKQIKVARALGVDQSTLSIWVKRLGLREKTVLESQETIHA